MKQIFQYRWIHQLFSLCVCSLLSLVILTNSTRDVVGRSVQEWQLPKDLFDYEHYLAAKEYERTASLWQDLRKEGYELYGFFHTSIYQGQWREAMKEQLLLLDGKRRLPQREDVAEGRYDFAFYDYQRKSTEDDKRYESYRANRDRVKEKRNGIHRERRRLNIIADLQAADPQPSHRAKHGHGHPKHSTVIGSGMEDKGNHTIDIGGPYTSLLAMSDGFYLNVVGPDPQQLNIVKSYVQSLKLQYYHKITFNFNHSFTRSEWEQLNPNLQKTHEKPENLNYSCGEYPTVMAMRGFCRGLIHDSDLQRNHLDKDYHYIDPITGQRSTNQYDYYTLGSKDYIDSKISEKFHNMFPHPSTTTTTTIKDRKALVFYFHLKGACCHKSRKGAIDNHNNPVARWREYMNTFNIEFPSICLRALTHPNRDDSEGSYSTCGTDVKDAHYSGNFFWSTCEHVNSMPPLFSPFDWIQPEFFVLLVAFDNDLTSEYSKYCAYSAFNSEFGLYSNELSRMSYLPTLWQLIVGGNETSGSMRQHRYRPHRHSGKLHSHHTTLTSPAWSLPLPKFFDPIKQPQYVKDAMAGIPIFQVMNESTKMPALHFCKALRTPSQYLSLLRGMPEDKVKMILNEKLKLPLKDVVRLMDSIRDSSSSSLMLDDHNVSSNNRSVILPRVLYPELVEVLMHYTGLRKNL